MYFDTDAGGVVHNIVYLRFIETARTLLAIQMGMSFEEIERTGIHPVVTRTEIDYKRPAKLGEILLIEGRVTEWSGIRFWVEFEVLRAADRAILASCRQALALVQTCRELGLATDFPLKPAKIGKQFQEAEHLGARHAVLVGQEWPQVKLKHLPTRTEETLDHAALAAKLKTYKLNS